MERREAIPVMRRVKLAFSPLKGQCPRCAAPFNVSQGFVPPKMGDVGFCVSCGATLIFESSNHVRLARLEDLDKFSPFTLLGAVVARQDAGTPTNFLNPWARALESVLAGWAAAPDTLTPEMVHALAKGALGAETEEDLRQCLAAALCPRALIDCLAEKVRGETS
jgi:hypothetical protein